MDYLLQYIARQTSELSTNSVYQILIGKRTAATLYFAFKHDLTAYFNLFQQLDKQIWQATVAGYQGSDDEVSELSLQLIKNVLPRRQGLVVPLNHYNRHIAFKQLIQSLSFVIAEEKQYVPLTNQLFIQYMIKEFFRYYQLKFSVNKKEIARQIYRSLLILLQQYDDAENNILLMQLEGAKISAWTNQQIASKMDIPFNIVIAISEALLDRLCDDAIKRLDKNDPLVIFCNQMLSAFPNWNDSVELTKDLKDERFSPEQIANQRQLKLSTITDHFVEISLTNTAVMLPYILKMYQTDDASFLKLEPPSNFNDFQSKKGHENLPFWTYRYWQIYYLQYGRSGHYG